MFCLQPRAISRLLVDAKAKERETRVTARQSREYRLREGGIMTDRDRSSGLERRAFLGGATLAGVASVLAPGAALGQTAAPIAPAAPGPAILPHTAEHLVGSAVNYAYAVKAGPFVFLNGHEGYDFAAGVVPAVEGPAGFSEYGRPGLRPGGDFFFCGMGR